MEAKDLPARLHFNTEGDSFTVELRRDYRIVFWNHTLDVGGKISVPYWPGHKTPIKSFVISMLEQHRYQFDADAKRLRGTELGVNVPAVDLEL